MYTDKITQAVAEAVKQILATEKLHPNQQKLDVHEPEKDELTSNDFKMLRKGKKADVKEGWQDMLDDVKKRAGPQPSGGSGVKQGSRYGGSKQKDEPEDKKPMKEEVGQIDELAISPQARADAKAREKDYHDQSEFPVHPERSLVLHTTSKLKSAYSHHSRTAADPIDKSEGHNAVKAMRRLDREFDKRKIPQNKRFAKEEVDINAINGVQMSTIDEKHMTEPEMKKKEEVVKSMKKGLTGFKERYGDKAKSVMYATATKIAKDKA